VFNNVEREAAQTVKEMFEVSLAPSSASSIEWRYLPPCSRLADLFPYWLSTTLSAPPSPPNLRLEFRNLGMSSVG